MPGFSFSLLVCLLFCLSSSAWADWPTFQGTAERGGSRPHVPPLQQPRIRWQRQLGLMGWLHNPVIVGQTVFVINRFMMGRDDEWRDSYLSALDLNTGQTKWRVNLTKHFKSHGVSAYGLSVWGDRVLVSLTNHTLAAYTKGGKLQWYRRFTFSQRIEMETYPPERFDLISPVMLLGNTLVVGTNQGELFGLDPQSGKTRWYHRLAGAIRNGLSADLEQVYVATTAGELLAVNEQGQIRWKRMMQTPYPPWSDRTDTYPLELYAAPVLVGDHVIVAAARRHRFPTPAVWALHKHSGQTVWQAQNSLEAYPEHFNLRSSPTRVEQLLVIAEPLGNQLMAIDLTTGVLKWRQPVGFAMPYHWPSGASAGHVVYMPRHDGGLYALHAQTGEVLWRFYLGDPSLAGPTFPRTEIISGYAGHLPGVGDAIYASPALADDGTLIVPGGSGFVYALEETR